MMVPVQGARWWRHPTAEVTGAAIDSRAVRDGDAFFAFRGAHVDGHAYVADAAERGASIVVVEHEIDPEVATCGVLVVPDVHRALLEFASDWRSRHDAHWIGITGSNGKTTTVRLVDAVLATTMTGSASTRSFNNDIGLPVTMCSARGSYAVCEVGTSARGEIARLRDLLRPTIGLVTSIGRAHMEGLGGVEGVFDEKISLLEGLGGDRAILNVDSDVARRRAPSGLTTYGRDAGDVRVEILDSTTRSTRARLSDGFEFLIPLPGAHNAVNACGAILVGRAVGVPDDAIR
ncbi:MAG: UDP-N-acetylmuramoyl-tripeptide--D-alanyl-D-alanine ligase, partial [Phycisphaerales bacterium]|nr:UDP-N-acetylmuramoyl-tripeptide--D-alanyl-D-alanine ligase [Phycisphaerales bacterium]